MKFVLYFLCLAVVLLSAGACRTNEAGRPPDFDPQSVERGEVIYADHCAVCHGASLEGEADWKMQNTDGSFRAPPHDASGHTWHHSDTQLIDAIRRGGARLPDDIGGISAMPAYESILTEQEIDAVLDFIKSTWPEEQRRYQWELMLREEP